MSNKIGNWRLDKNWNRILSDVPVCEQSPQTTDYLNGHMVCDMIANKHIARRIIASVRACKDIILEDLEQADSGYWVKQAKTAADEWAKACEGWDASMAMNAELLEALKTVFSEAEKAGITHTPGGGVGVFAYKGFPYAWATATRDLLARISGADTAQYGHPIDEQTEPDYDNLARDYTDAEMDANQPTPYDP